MRLLTILLLTASLALTARAQVAEQANRGYQSPEDRARLARMLDNPDRETSQKPRELVRELGVRKGEVVADIGTGVGFMIPYFLEAVGPQGKIYAEDIQQDFLDKVEAKKAAHGWTNVTTVLGEQADPKLPVGAIDLAFILDAYHHFNYPVKTMRNIRKALAPDGRLAVIDFYRSRKHPRMTPERLKNHIRKDRDGFAAEIESAGFKLERTFDHLPHQYVLVFRKAAP